MEERESLLYSDGKLNRIVPFSYEESRSLSAEVDYLAEIS